MTLNLNNQIDGYYSKVYLLNENTGGYEEVKELIAAGGSAGGGGANLTGYALTTDMLSLLSGYTSSASLNNSLSGYTDTTNLNILLSTKQNNIIAGTGLSLVGNTINSTHLPLVLQADGVAQLANTINFVGYTSSLTNNVLNLARMAWQDGVTLRYSSSSTDKNLTQGSTGQLLWNGAELQLKQNSFQTINSVRPISASLTGAGSLTIESLWMPSTVTGGAGIFADSANDTLGTLTLSGYDLRWLTNGVPTLYGGIKCLHFKSGFSIAETLNIGTGQNQLDITSNGVTDAEMKSHIASSVWAPANSGLSSVANPGTGTVYFEVDTSIIATNASVTTQLALKANDSDVTTAFASVNVELSQKLESSLVLTAVPANMPFSTLVADLSKISNMITGASGISLGTGTGSGQRIACYEAGSHYFYGIGLVEHSGVLPGVGIWSSTSTNVPHQNSSSSSGVDPHLMVSSNGNVGIGIVAPTERIHVVGNILATGTISGSTKLFDIPHESKPGMRLRHWCTESDTPGGNLIYKRQIEAYEEGVNDLIMPEWFGWVASNVMIFCSGEKHFGQCWGECDEINPCIIHLNVSQKGKYNIMILADRNDKCATTMCPQEVEYTPVVQPVINMHDMD